MLFKRILITLVICLVYQPVWAKKYTIGPGETYETFSAFHAAISPLAGDVIDGGGNTFNEVIKVNASGSFGNPIIYQNFINTYTGNNKYVFVVSAHSWIKLFKVTISGGETASILLTNPPDSDAELNIVIDQCAVTNGTNQGHGIRVNCSATTISNTTISDINGLGDGIAHEGNDCEYYSNTIIIDGEGDGIQLINTGDGSDDVHIHDNRIICFGTTKSCITSDSTNRQLIEDNFLYGGGYVINCEGHGSIIRRNMITVAPEQKCVQIEGNDIEFYSNILINNRGASHGVIVAGIPVATGFSCFNNTFTGNGDWTKATIRLQPNAKVTKLANNIFSGQTRYISAAQTATITVASNNIYPTAYKGAWRYGGVNYGTLSLFQSGTLLGENSSMEDPQLDSTYTPTNTNVLYGGAPIAKLNKETDYDGDQLMSLDGQWPIGAQAVSLELSVTMTVFGTMQMITQ